MKIKNLLAKYKELVLHLLFWALYFSSINVEWGTNWLDKTIRSNTPAQIIVLFFPVFFYANAFWAIPKILKGKNWIRYTVVIVLLVCSLELLRCLITIVLMPELTLDVVSVEKEIFSRDSFLFGSPSIFWLALVCSFGYRFTKDRMTNTKLIEQLKTEKLQMELSI